MAGQPDMEEKLLEAMHRTKDNLKLTTEEQDRLTKAFKEPEFKKLMEDYLQEISDPKNRAEYEAYISQLENEDKVPAGMKLVRPKAGFCVKAKRLGQNEKVFMNICSAPEAGAPSCTKSKRGQNWEIPHLMGPPHMKQDNKKKPCMTFDVCFHPETLQRAAKNAQFKQLVIQTAMETVQEKTKKFGQEIRLERQYRILKGRKAIGGAPNTLSVRVDGASEPPPAALAAMAGAAAGATAADATSGADGGVAAPGAASAATKSADPASEEKREGGVREPAVRIVERGVFKMRDHMVAEHSAAAPLSRRPEHLVIKIVLAGVSSLSSVQLDLSDREIVLEVPGRYQLNRRLPYAVDSDNASAKFYAKKNLLEVVAPVMPPEVADDAGSGADQEEPVEGTGEVEAAPAPAAEELREPRKGGEDAAACVAPAPPAAEASEQAELDPAPVSTPSVSTPGQGAARAEDAADVAVANEAPAATDLDSRIAKLQEMGLAPDMAKRVAEAQQNFSQWKTKGDEAAEAEAKAKEEARANAEKQAAATDAAAIPAPDSNDGESTEAPADAPEFVPATTWQGVRPGYAFKTGSRGLGYYVDGPRRRVMGSGTEASVASETSGTTSASAANVNGATNADAPTFVPPKLPPHRFRQDLRTTTLLIQVADLSEEDIAIDVKPSEVLINFTSGNKQFGFRLSCPGTSTILPSQCRMHVSGRNVALILHKGQSQLWDDMQLAELSSEDVELLRGSPSGIADPADQGAGSASAASPSATEDGDLAQEELQLQNTLMFGLD